MPVFVDLKMSTDTALKLLKFIAQQDRSDPDLCSLFLGDRAPSEGLHRVRISICTGHFA
jgi:hypothetical protein